MLPKLIVISGSPQGVIFTLDHDEMSIGRIASNHIRLVDPSVSRKHAVIKQEKGEFKLSDLNSFNGTCVNGVPVFERVLLRGDHVASGDVLLLFLRHEVEEEITPVLF